jgi:hypothetical protein
MARLAPAAAGPAVDATSSILLPVVSSEQELAPTDTPSATVLPMPTEVSPTQVPVGVLETFESPSDGWQVFSDIASSASIERSNVRAAAGNYSAHLTTNSPNAMAQIRVNFSDAAVDHQWEERPGTWHWQLASVYLPSTTLASLGPSDYLTLAGMWPSSGGTFGWFLRVKQGGELYVYGYDNDGISHEFRAYGTLPQDRWVELEIGLHSQAGPGVKRAFAFVVGGEVYGWYHQGHMGAEVYDRAAVGILKTNHQGPLDVFVDQWRYPGTSQFPSGADHRPTAGVQTQDYRSQSGVQAQYDWATWKNNPTLSAQLGLYTPVDRLQAGRNIDRMPNLSSGWAEIEIDWTNGPPPVGQTLTGAFAGLIGFHKEVNREENLEVAPVRDSDGKIRLFYDAWTSGSPVIFARWELPAAATSGGSNIPETNDIIRVRWEQLGATRLNVRISYYDASAGTWYNDVIDDTRDLTAISDSSPSNAKINYLDGYHQAASITIDTPYYSIHRFKLGTLDTYPGL